MEVALLLWYSAENEISNENNEVDVKDILENKGRYLNKDFEPEQKGIILKKLFDCEGIYNIITSGGLLFLGEKFRNFSWD